MGKGKGKGQGGKIREGCRGKRREGKRKRVRGNRGEEDIGEGERRRG